jgi:hypothetical protein
MAARHGCQRRDETRPRASRGRPPRWTPDRSAWLGGADLIRLRARQVANFTTEMQSNDFVMKSAEATDLADGGF